MSIFRKSRKVAPITAPVIVSCAPINRPAFRPAFPMDSADARIAARIDESIAFENRS